MSQATKEDALPSETALLPSLWTTLGALFAAPAAWLLQMWLSEPIAAHACYPDTRTLDHPLVMHLTLWLILIGVVALLIGCGAMLLAWRGRAEVMAHTPEKSPRRFVFEVALLSSLGCSVAIIFTLSAALLVSPCAPWL